MSEIIAYVIRQIVDNGNAVQISLTEDVETAVDMLMKRWRSVVKYWEDIDDIWDDNNKIPKIIVKYKREWERIVDKMDREVRQEVGRKR